MQTTQANGHVPPSLIHTKIYHRCRCRCSLIYVSFENYSNISIARKFVFIWFQVFVEKKYILTEIKKIFNQYLKKNRICIYKKLLKESNICFPIANLQAHVKVFQVFFCVCKQRLWFQIERWSVCNNLKILKVTLLWFLKFI